MNFEVNYHPNATAEERLALVENTTKAIASVKRWDIVGSTVQVLGALSFVAFLFWLACAL